MLLPLISRAKMVYKLGHWGQEAATPTFGSIYMIVTRSYWLHSQNYLMNDHWKIQSSKWNILNDTVIYKDSQSASRHLSNCNIRLLSFYSHQCLGKYGTLFMCEMFTHNSLHFQLFCPIQYYILMLELTNWYILTAWGNHNVCIIWHITATGKCHHRLRVWLFPSSRIPKETHTETLS
jgi:hypothetical protein